MRKSLLILAEDHDIHADAVHDLITRRQYTSFRLDPELEWTPTGDAPTEDDWSPMAKLNWSLSDDGCKASLSWHDQKIDLSNMNLKDFLLKIIDNQYYKKDILSINLIFAFLQMYFIKKINNLDSYSVYTKFVNSIDDIKRFNLDIESLFIRLRHQIIND